MTLGANYAQIEELKARLGINDSTDDIALANALSSASRACEKVCRRVWNDAVTPSARLYDPQSEVLAVVDDFSTTAGFVLAVDQDDDGVFEETWTTADYELRPLNQIEEGVTGWPYWQIWATERNGLTFPNIRAAAIQVTARWGWSTVPPGVKEAVLIAAEETWKVKDAPFGVAGMGDFGAIRVRENPKVMALLNPYRRAGVRVRG